MASLPGPLPELAFRRIVKVSAHGEPAECDDAVALEAPLEVRQDGVMVATTLRTPGDDVVLALGLLHTRGELRSVDQVRGIVRMRPRGSAPAAVDVRVERVGERRRDTASLQLRELHPIVDGALLSSCVVRLQQLQPGFERTGSLHAAAAFDSDGNLLACCEDVGRHNAVDKVVGKLLCGRLVGVATHGRPALLAVSGRAGSDILQKAIAAAIPIVASISAPTSLAVDLARQSGVTLAGFVRGDRFNLYSHPSRVRGNACPQGR